MAGKSKGYPKKDEKKGTYYFVLEAGRDANGKRKRIVRKGFKTAKEAKAEMNKLAVELANNDAPEDYNKTFAEYLKYWIENYVKTNLRPKTGAEYVKIIKTHIEPSLGHIKLKELKSTHLQTYYSQKLQKLSAQTVKHHHSLISAALRDAIGWEYIRKNVAKGAKPPKPVKKEMKKLNSDQLNLLFKVAKEKSPVYYPITFAAAHTGMRKSELLGLTWDKVDFDEERLLVMDTITESNGKYFFNPSPKGKEVRPVKLTKELIKLFRELKTENEKRVNTLGQTFNPRNLVFCNSRGNIMSPSEITRAFKRVLKAAGLPDETRFHDLRHTHATLLLKANIHPKIVSDRLGHSRINVTLDTYSHIDDELQKIAVAKLNEML
ncbi:site-specific recombinase XerD [Mycobacteroides abscessus subsp. abscessus]|nr:site-specific recombinase XerD [Mycobacteroides abscessus subsp. abscessus]